MLLVKVIKSLARGRGKGRHSCRLVSQTTYWELPFFLVRAMRKPSQPFLGHGQSGLPEEAESRSCPTSVHKPDPEPPPPPLLTEPPALALVRFANFNLKLLLPIRQISNSNCLQPSTANPSQPAIGQLQSTKKKLLKNRNKTIRLENEESSKKIREQRELRIIGKARKARNLGTVLFPSN